MIELYSEEGNVKRMNSKVKIVMIVPSETLPDHYCLLDKHYDFIISMSAWDIIDIYRAFYIKKNDYSYQPFMLPKWILNRYSQDIRGSLIMEKNCYLHPKTGKFIQIIIPEKLFVEVAILCKLRRSGEEDEE